MGINGKIKKCLKYYNFIINCSEYCFLFYKKETNLIIYEIVKYSIFEISLTVNVFFSYGNLY